MANVVMLFMGDMESPGHSIKCQATDSNSEHGYKLNSEWF